MVYGLAGPEAILGEEAAAAEEEAMIHHHHIRGSRTSPSGAAQGNRKGKRGGGPVSGAVR